MEPQTETKKNKLTIILVIVAIILFLAVGILFGAPKVLNSLKSTNALTQDTKIQEQAQVTPTQNQAEITATPVIPSPSATPVPTVVKRADFDKDIQSIDSLDLSAPENQYGENNIDDLSN